MKKTLEFWVWKGRKCMGITSSTKVTNAATIPCGGTFNVTLALTAAPDITIDGCEDSVVFDAGDLVMDSLCRILQLDGRCAMCAPASGWR